MIYGVSYLEALHGIKFLFEDIKCLLVLVLAEADQCILICIFECRGIGT